MVEKSSEPALRDILDAIEHVNAKMEGTTLDSFRADLDRRRIVERSLEIISEASRRLPGEMKDRHPDIPWKKIAGIGNVLRHEYDAVSPRILLDIAVNDLNSLKTVCRAELMR